MVARRLRGVGSELEYRDLHTQAVRDGMFATMPAQPGVSAALWRLSDAGVHIRVVTHRLGMNGTHEAAAASTVTWLDEQNVPYRDLCFVATKAHFDADVNLDDAPHNIASLRAAGKDAIVFDAPSNQHVNGPRARSWTEAEDLIAGRLAAAQRA